MATPSYSAEEVLRVHYGELLAVLDALSDLVTIAGNLFSRRIIMDNTLQEVQVTGQQFFLQLVPTDSSIYTIINVHVHNCT